MPIKLDEKGYLVSTPPELFDIARRDPVRLLGRYLMAGTPCAFPDYDRYCDFLEAVAERTGIHRKNLYVRGSCHIGYSIAPDKDKVWLEVASKSDLDLVIVDTDYFRRCEEELVRWESRNPVRDPRGPGAAASARRAQDRQFNCVRDMALPAVVCVHHRRTMQAVAELEHCGCKRKVSAFIYPDWHSATQRYEYDLRLLCEGVEKRWFPQPPDVPLPRVGVGTTALAPAGPTDVEGKPPPGFEHSGG
jgi:hypothetical protein